jgi:uncharacterized protein
MKDAEGNPISIPPKDASQVTRYIIGGSMHFGFGWALLGACPGPMFALLGSGLTIMVVPICSTCRYLYIWNALR